MIDPHAIVHPSAEIADDVQIGPFTVIGANVSIAGGTWIGPHVVVNGPTRIGRDNRIYQFSSIGEVPQDKKYHGEETELVIGDRNLIREYVTINRGTEQDGAVTRIADDNWIMAYVHIAHDCSLGNNIIMANGTSLAGHVRVDDYVGFGGFSLVHQFCHIGAHAYSGHSSQITRDVPPFVLVAGVERTRPYGVNQEGLKRRGFSGDELLAIKKAYKVLYRSGLKLVEARTRLSDMAQETPALQPLVTFLSGSKRSILR